MRDHAAATVDMQRTLDGLCVLCVDNDSDILAGMESGLATVLVLSGCTSRTDVNDYPYRPTYILNGVGDIPSK